MWSVEAHADGFLSFVISFLSSLPFTLLFILHSNAYSQA